MMTFVAAMARRRHGRASGNQADTVRVFVYGSLDWRAPTTDKYNVSECG